MATNWQWRLILVAPLAVATAQNRDALAAIIAASSGETVEDERKLFQSATKIALTIAPTVQVGYGISLPVKLAMRDDLQSLITTINAGQIAANRIQWYLLHNDGNENELIASSRNTAYVINRIGQVFRFSDVGTDLGIVVLDEG